MSKLLYSVIISFIILLIIAFAILSYIDRVVLNSSKTSSQPSTSRTSEQLSKESYHLLSSKKKDEPDPVSSPVETPQPRNKPGAPPSLNLRLVGTTVFGEKSSVILEDFEKETQGVYRLRDTVKGFTIIGPGGSPNDRGIEVHGDRCIIEESTFSMISSSGIVLYGDHTTIRGNTFSNQWASIELRSSTYAKIWGNDFLGTGIMISNGSLGGWIHHDIAANNSVNGNPLYYYDQAESITVPSGAGQIILADCENMTIEEQNCSGTFAGIIIGFSQEITIRNNTLSENLHSGIRLMHSSDSLIENNICDRNHFGMYVLHSDSVIIDNNHCSKNR